MKEKQFHIAYGWLLDSHFARATEPPNDVFVHEL